MTQELLIALVGFAFVTSVTPGPNNLMLLASGVNFGLRRTVPHMLGISIGHSLMVFLVGLGLAGGFSAWPPALTVLKLASVAYMLWLAWEIAHAAAPGEGRAKAQALRAQLDTDQFARDLEDTVGALRARPECTGKVGVMGFCLGGKFAYLSSVRHKIGAAVSYYGVQIDQHLDEAGQIGCPLLLHFAEDDAHVPPDKVELIRQRLAPSGKAEVHVYPGTVHGFNRYGYPPHHEAQAAVARKRTVEHFKRHLGA